MFAWGNGAALGCGTSDTTLSIPHHIEELDQYIVVDVSVGDSHCLALTLDCEVSFEILLKREMIILTINKYFDERLLRGVIM